MDTSISTPAMERSSRRARNLRGKSCPIHRDEAAIWKITWADPTYGEIIAIGSFKRKVAVFQNKGNNVWIEVVSHELHEGSVNHVEWASSAFGLKLFSAGSDGSVAILELKKGSWSQSSFAAH
jgi:WD40 repeat protein